jgi:hypothetical protein
MAQPDRLAYRLRDLAELNLRRPDSIATDDTSGAPVLVFDPPLTTTEQAALDDLTLMAKFAVSGDLSLAEFRSIKSDIVTARQYVGLPSPTNAQTIAAIRSLIRVVGALLRN